MPGFFLFSAFSLRSLDPFCMMREEMEWGRNQGEWSMHLPPQYHWKSENGLRILEVTGFSGPYQVRAGFTTRLGGKSIEPYESLNMGFHVGDDPGRVLANRQALAGVLEMPLQTWVAAEQVHGDRVAVIRIEDRGRGSLEHGSSVPETDALVTDQKGIVLTTYAADCVPLLFYSTEGVIGVAHAGWRGTVKKIAAKTVRVMCDQFRCDPGTIQVAIGPAIGPCCYEVDRPVRDAFAEIGLADVCTEEPPTKTLDRRWKCDLWLANKKILLEAGIPESHLYISKQCTSCHNDLYFSHRKEHGKTGRHMGFVYRF
jgi:YfiH family protein